MTDLRRPLLAATLLLSLAAPAAAGDTGAQLPPGSTFGEGRLSQPREVFYSELAGGKRSAQSVLGDLAFGSPFLLGKLAQQEGVSCESCHNQGASNPNLFVPGLSIRPGTFDTTGALFNPKTDNHMNDALAVPSLRGAKFNGPYGHDGRFASLRDFTRNVVVNEFAGAEPSPQILDALVAYMQDIALLPNPRLQAGGMLASTASAAEKRGQALFRAPFRHDPSLSCAGCHTVSSGFSDHARHDIGTGFFKTPTLLNANFNGPYFHDGRFDSYGEVVGYFDTQFDLGLSAQDRDDLVAYLTAIGDGDQPHETVTPTVQLDEIRTFADALPQLASDRDWQSLSFAIDGLAHEVRELQEFFPEATDPNVSGGRRERLAARRALGTVILALRRMQGAVDSHEQGQAEALFTPMRAAIEATAAPMEAAQPWSLFAPAVAARRMTALAQMDAAAGLAPRRRN